MKKVFVLIVCIGMIAGLGLGGFMMVKDALTNSNTKQSETQQEDDPKYTTRESAYASKYPDLSEEEVKKRVAMHLDETPSEAAKEVADPNSVTVLVNQYNVLNKDYIPEDLEIISQDDQGILAMRKEAANAYKELVKAAKAENIDLQLMTAYMPYEVIHESYTSLLEGNSKEAVDASFADAGASEYQTGLCGDIQIGKDEGAQQVIAQDPGYEWLQNHLQDYGFVIRYTQDKSQYTLMNGQPWHIRYVGKQAAQKMAEDHLCLEEYSL
ncbi:hypothetical protein C815_00831 [Firmicutes bacterium M10-2]|nr:hypothetical protein C815_00831 [Firmicutes bacterium M10-2]